MKAVFSACICAILIFTEFASAASVCPTEFRQTLAQIVADPEKSYPEFIETLPDAQKKELNKVYQKFIKKQKPTVVDIEDFVQKTFDVFDKDFDRALEMLPKVERELNKQMDSELATRSLFEILNPGADKNFAESRREFLFYLKKYVFPLTRLEMPEVKLAIPDQYLERALIEGTPAASHELIKSFGGTVQFNQAMKKIRKTITVSARIIVTGYAINGLMDHISRARVAKKAVDGEKEFNAMIDDATPKTLTGHDLEVYGPDVGFKEEIEMRRKYWPQDYADQSPKFMLAKEHWYRLKNTP